LVDQAPEWESQLFACHAHQIEARGARRKLQERAGLTPALDNDQIARDDDPRRGKLGQDEAIGFGIDDRTSRAVSPAGRSGALAEEGWGRVDSRGKVGVAKSNVSRLAHRGSRVNPALAVHGGKSREGADGFRVPEHQEPRVLQGVVEQRDDPVLETPGRGRSSGCGN
jgi:hypothetical protein